MALVGERGWHTWRGWRAGEAVARAPARGGEGRGETDLRLVGQLGMLAARWVGLKGTGPKGQTGQRGGWAGTEEKFSSK
jgi:hypothetical protein